MKRMLIAGALAFVAGGQALAADLPPPMAPPPRAPATYVPAPVPFYNWGGIYFGLNGGYGFGYSNWTATGGAFVHRQFQHHRLPRRRHGRIQLSVGRNRGRSGRRSLTGPISKAAPAPLVRALGGHKLPDSASYLGTARGRLGYAWDRVLLFATGGAAFTNDMAKAIDSWRCQQPPRPPQTSAGLLAPVSKSHWRRTGPRRQNTFT